MGIEYTAVVLGKSYQFDLEGQVIYVDATIDKMEVPNLWTAIKEAQASLPGIAYNQIAKGGGTDVLGTGVETYLTVTLLDNWEVSTLKTSGKFEVLGGNLIRADQADPFLDNPAITYIAFLSQAGIATMVETGSAVLPSDVADIARAVWDEQYSLHTAAGTFGKLMDLLRKANLTVDGVVTGTPTASAFDTDLTDPTGTHDHQLILFVTGVLSGYSRPISTFTNGANNTVTLEEAFPFAPSPGDEFVVLAQHIHPISEIADGVKNNLFDTALPRA